MYPSIGAPIYIPFVIFMYFYYRKTGKFPAPIAINTLPFMSFWGLPPPQPTPIPPPPPPTPNCPTCPTCPTRPDHPEIEEWAKDLFKDYVKDELRLMPVVVTFRYTFNYPGQAPMSEVQSLPPMPANQLPMAYQTIKDLVADANAHGKSVTQVSLVSITPVPERHFKPAVIQEAEAYANQRLSGHQLPFN